MAINLSQLLKDADEIIEKKALEKKSSPAISRDEVTKLAESLKAGTEASTNEWTPQEKLAHAIMLVATYANLPQLSKIASFEEKALKAGYSPSEVEAFIEKKAGIQNSVTLETLIPWLSE